jgi:ABC-type sugar transport system permease subunit
MTAEGEGVFDYYAIVGQLSIPTQIRGVLVFFISNSINLTWSCGIQTILFLAGLQGISDSLYEVSKIEGATKWQEFWMITVPMLRNILSLVVIYTMIALFTSPNNKIMMDALQLARETNYEAVSAMLWFYFVIVIAVIGIVMLFYHKRFVKKWE